MTRYTVVWHSHAADELAELWLEAPDRQSVSRASDGIDDELGEDPKNKGDRVSDRSRELIVLPLHVLFRVKPDDRIVEVFSVVRVETSG